MNPYQLGHFLSSLIASLIQSAGATEIVHLMHSDSVNTADWQYPHEDNYQH